MLLKFSDVRIIYLQVFDWGGWSSRFRRALRVWTKPERMMHLDASEVEELQTEPDFKKARQYMACLYRDARKNELKLNVDKYGGFGLFNKTGKRIKPRLQPLDDPVGVQKEIPAELQGQISDFSVIVGSSVQKKEHVLLGPLRSCSPNTVYFTGCTHCLV